MTAAARSPLQHRQTQISNISLCTYILYGPVLIRLEYSSGKAWRRDWGYCIVDYNWGTHGARLIVSIKRLYIFQMAPLRSKVLFGCLLVLVSAVVLVKADNSDDEATVEVEVSSFLNASVCTAICHI